MIQKINSLVGVKVSNTSINIEKKHNSTNNEYKINNELSRMGKPYFLSFKGINKNQKLEEIEDAMTPKAEEVYKKAQKLAKNYKHNEVKEIHVLKIMTDMFINTIEEMDKGNLDALDENSFTAINILKDQFGEDAFKEQRKTLKKILKEETKILDEKLKEIPATSTPAKNPRLSKAFVNDIYNSVKSDETEQSGTSDSIKVVSDWYLFDSSMWPSDEKTYKETTQPFISKLYKGLMTYKSDKKIPLDFYNDMSKKIWKNLAVGRNMFVIYDKALNKEYLLDTFEENLKNNKNDIDKFNAENTEINRYNGNVNVDFVIDEIKRGIKDKDKNHVYIFDYDNVATNTSQKSICQFEEYVKELAKYPNLKFVISSEKEDYYSTVTKKDDVYKDFSPVSLPIINKDQAKKMFREEKALTRNLKKDFSQHAIDKAVEIADDLNGYYPEKAQKVLNLISSYYIDKNVISKDDVANYVNEAKDVFKSADKKDNNSVQVILDTGKKLKDIIGLKATQKEAASIVRQIKDHSVGTKGYIIYSQDGEPGSGRYYTASAIAGEAKIPFLEINAVDFGTKDVSIFDGDSTTPETAMKKLFSMAKAQAETNPHKALVLYIQNFEYFSCGDQVSEYHEKAMSQLLREMNTAQKQGLNVVVMGSVGNPDLIGVSTMKSFKFVDKIEVESPERNKNARKELINYYLDKKKIKLDAKNNGEKTNIIDKFATMTEYFSLLKIMTLLDKVKNVSKERNRDSVNVADFIEAYMQLECGRPNVKEITPFTKNITTSHECGHALNETIMNEITKSIKPWAESSTVSFITLDPRSSYLGAVYGSNPNNDEYTFERAFSSIVTDFGGYSCENHFYGINGSVGITSDMEMATSAATNAVAIMGQGHFFGKKSLEGVAFADDDDKARINKDIRIFLKNAETVSNMITKQYDPFIRKFTEKYSNLVGTGECIITGETFRKELADWENTLSHDKQHEIFLMKEKIKHVMELTQKGEVFEEKSSQKHLTPFTFKTPFVQKIKNYFTQKRHAYNKRIDRKLSNMAEYAIQKDSRIDKEI